jgi:quercetin dioxygenase-like cupin family protein
MSRLVLAMIAVVALPGFAAQNPSTPNTQASSAAIATNRSQETCPWPANLDGVKAAPETHKVIFENEHVRVLQVTIAPHSKEPVHTHCWPSTLYIQQVGDIIVRDDKEIVLFDARQLKENEKQKPPFVLWSPPEGPHSDENRDDSPATLIQVENKVATNRPQEICPWPGDLDGAKVASETHKVIFENEHVRVLEVIIPPHSKEPVHSHCLPSTLYVQQIGEIIVRDPDGKLIFDSRQMKESEKQKAPFVLWNAGEGPHSDENPTDVAVRIIQIEHKD